MIAVFVGSSSIPFDRLLEAVDTIAGDEEIVVQRGPSAVQPRHGSVVDFMPFDDVVERIAAARAVVTHAGVGTILISLMHGKRPIVVPRLHRFAEAVDDHQLELARELARTGLVDLVEDLAELSAAVGRAGTTVRAPRAGDESPLAVELRGLLREIVGTPSTVELDEAA